MSKKTAAEQIAALESSRAAKAARMSEVMQKSIDEGRSTDEAEQEEFDTLEREVDAIDGDLKRWRAIEKANIAAARPVSEVKSVEDGATLRGGPIRVTSPNVPPGVRFARVAKCIGVAKGSLMQAAAVAEHHYGDDQGVVNVLKAAVAAGTTTNDAWAGNLVGDETGVFADFVEFLRPMTILGKFGNNGVPGLRRVPFRTPLIGQSSGGAGYWVGESTAKPLTKFDFTRTTLSPLKVANIAVVTEELLRDSSPSADMLIRDSLAAALRDRLDTDFIDPSKTAAAGVSPASITNGATTIASGGTDADAAREDVRRLFAAFIEENNAPTTGVWIMPATTALALSMMVNALGQPEFSGINMNGGSFFGMPVITSQYVPYVGSPVSGYVVLVNASDVYLSDDGGISIDMSREASLQMDDAPSMSAGGLGSPAAPSTAQLVSLWQTNAVGFRAERTINWALRRTGAVKVLSGVAWGV